MLRIAVPNKGSLAESSVEILKEAGYRQRTDVRDLVLVDPDKADELLPPQSGFFFGSTDVDEWYLEQLKYTVERLDVLLELPEVKNHKINFYYSSSW